MIPEGVKWVCDECADALKLKRTPYPVGCAEMKCDVCGKTSMATPASDFGWDGVSVPDLHVANDRKTRFYPTQDNTFGLPAGPIELGGSCPWCTRGKGGCFHIPEGRRSPDCYAYNIERAFKEAGRRIRENMDLLESASRMDWALQKMVSGFRDKTKAYAKKKGLDPRKLLKFRIHWAGDMFSDEYAMAWAKVCRDNPDITFWTYTRSYDRAHFLAGMPNLKLYLSTDMDSWEKGVRTFMALGGPCDKNLGVAFMAKTEEEILECKRLIGSHPERFGVDKGLVQLFSAASAPVSKCPVDLGRMELTGACSKCKMCFSQGSQFLWFKC